MQPATGLVRTIAADGRDLVRADAVLTAIAVLTPPVTGYPMMRMAGHPVALPWLPVSPPCG